MAKGFTEEWHAARLADGARDREATDTTQVKTHHTLRLPVPLERDILAEVLEALTLCPCVGWFARQNTGAMRVEDRYVRFAFKGCSDIIGQLRDGLFLAIECKRAGKNPTEDQLAFLTKVAANGGIAFVARGSADVFTHLRHNVKRGG